MVRLFRGKIVVYSRLHATVGCHQSFHDQHVIRKSHLCHLIDGCFVDSLFVSFHRCPFALSLRVDQSCPSPLSSLPTPLPLLFQSPIHKFLRLLFRHFDALCISHMSARGFYGTVAVWYMCMCVCVAVIFRKLENMSSVYRAVHCYSTHCNTLRN